MTQFLLKLLQSVVQGYNTAIKKMEIKNIKQCGLTYIR